MTEESAVDIIATHYVQLLGNVGPNPSKIFTKDRYGAMKLLKSFNTYGVDPDRNKKLWAL